MKTKKNVWRKDFLSTDMITVRHLALMLDDAISSGKIDANSEVRYVDRDRNDCSFEDQYQTIGPGLTTSGVPIDRRYGDGAFFLAQESALQPAPKQLLMDLNW